MDELIKILDQYLTSDCKQIIISNPRHKGEFTKLKIRPIELRNELYFQVSSYVGKQVLHENVKKDKLLSELIYAWMECFKQLQLIHREETITALVNKKGAVTISRKKIKTAVPASLSHNRRKNYILDEGCNAPFLIDLGVMTKEGRVVSKQYDKFRQINRFLEFIKDIEPELSKDRPIYIIDFGCGKSYLTFAMYYYFTVLCRREVHITGLDLKEDVVSKCNRLAKKYGYGQLHFEVGDIKDFEETQRVDMVVSLHACDTATDYAIYKAVCWNAKVILSVPCCQHELNECIAIDSLSAMLSYGIMKERFSAMATDAMRANLLSCLGYETKLLEFVDMEHTPKNLLIRGVKREGAVYHETEEFQRFRSFIGQELTLERLLKEGGYAK